MSPLYAPLKPSRTPPTAPRDSRAEALSQLQAYYCIALAMTVYGCSESSSWLLLHPVDRGYMMLCLLDWDGSPYTSSSFAD